MARFDVGSLTPDGIQALIDAEIEQRELAAYVEWVRYVPQGQEVPDGATHLLTVKSLTTSGEVLVAVKGRGVYPTLLDALLAVF